MEVWENEKCCGNTSQQVSVLQLFQVLANFVSIPITQYQHAEHVFLCFVIQCDKINLFTLIINM